jgi:hypothetical protein
LEALKRLSASPSSSSSSVPPPFDDGALVVLDALRFGRGRAPGVRLRFGRARGLRPLIGETGDGRVNGDDGSFGHELLFQGPLERARQLDRHLVGHHLDDRLVLRDVLAFGDEPLDDFTFDHRLGEFGKNEFSGHHGSSVR